MIAVFLRGELRSSRFAPRLVAALERDGRSADLLLEPSLDDATANAYRRALLDEHRAYGRREGLFLGFPEDVDWSRAAFAREELLDVLYIGWEWWLRITGGTRRPRDAAARIRAGEVPGASPEEHERYVASDSELIVATTPDRSRLVLVEGHVRLTAYALFPERVPDEVEVLVGISPAMPRWCQF
jgi:hypothetical protein